MTSIFFGIVLFGFILIGLPITIAFFGASIVAIILSPSISLDIIPSLIFGSTSGFVLVAVPFFILAGKIMEYGGHSLSIFRFANSMVGWLTGGLGHVNILASMLFGAMSGSASADAAGLGQIEIPAMIKFNYPLGYSTAVTAASATLATLIPPSINMVIYAVNAGVSVSKALIAGFLPGIIVGLGLMMVNFIYARKNNWGTNTPFSIKEFYLSFLEAFFPLLTPIILIGGIATGFFTPTEASAVAVLYSLLLVMVQKRPSFYDIKKIFIETASSVGAVLIIVATASVVSYILTLDKVPMIISKAMLSLTGNKYILLLLINLLLLAAGCFFETIVAIMLFFPILKPIVLSLGVDLLHFGVIMVANLAIGMLTPPVGSVLYASSTVGKIKIHELVRALAPFYFVMIVTLMLITFAPQISLSLPNFLWR